MNRRTSARKTWRFRIWQTAAVTFLLITVSTMAKAAVSLDGSNCVLFAGQIKRELAVCVAWEAEGRTLSISLVGRGPNTVEQIILRRDGGEPFQTLHLDAQPPIGPSDVGLLYEDMNFDGHGDLGIMRTGDLSARQPFYYFLYDPSGKRFVRSSLLETMSNVSFDAKTMRVVTRWRDGTYQYKDSFEWAGHSLKLRTRERRGGAQRRCIIIVFDWQENKRTAREPRPCN